MSGRSPVQARLGTPNAWLPERSKGVDLRSTVFALVGSNPTPCTTAATAAAAARVAQWIRRGTSNPKTAGSSPAVGCFLFSFFFFLFSFSFSFFHK
jgi:hypothetical protein